MNSKHVPDTEPSSVIIANIMVPEIYSTGISFYKMTVYFAFTLFQFGLY